MSMFDSSDSKILTESMTKALSSYFGKSKDLIPSNDLVNIEEFEKNRKNKEEREEGSESKNSKDMEKRFAELEKEFSKSLNVNKSSIKAYEAKEWANYALELLQKKSDLTAKPIYERAKKAYEDAARLQSIEKAVELKNTTITDFGKVLRQQQSERESERKQIELDYKKAKRLAEEETDETKRNKMLQKAEHDREIGLAGLIDKAGASDIFKGIGSDMLDGAGLDSIIGNAIGLASPALMSAMGPIGAVLAVLDKINGQIGKGIQESANLARNYLGRIDARLQGTEENWNKINNWTSAFAASQYVNMKSLTENVGALADKGIAFNLEQRALLETIKDKVVTTFDSMDASLTRLVRLQQADVTKAQMGAEVGLTQFFNSMFMDSSYLSDMYDSVADSILDTASQLNYESSTELQYIIQKWLGSLYSVGLSSSGISTIAAGLNQLGTGDIDALHGSAVGPLFALSARNADVSYTDILKEGLNASNVNSLMKSMVEYLQQIAEDTSSNNVARRAIYQNIGAGLSFSDIRAITNLSSSDIESIYNSNVSYSQSQALLNQSLGQVAARTSVGERADNLVNNALLAVGNALIGNGENMTNYILWSLGDMLPGVLGEALQTGVLAGNLLFSGLKHIGNLFGGNFDTDGDIISVIKNMATGFGGEMFVDDYLMNKLVDLTGGGDTTVTPRGLAFIPRVEAGTVSSGISYSSEIGSTSAEAQNYSLYRQSQLTTMSASNQTGTAGAVRDVGDIFAELFEQQLHPIRVSIAKVEGDAKSDLGIGFNGMLVDVQESDINSLINSVYTVRSSM